MHRKVLVEEYKAGISALKKELLLHNTEGGKFSSQRAHWMATGAVCFLLTSFLPLYIHSKNVYIWGFLAVNRKTQAFWQLFSSLKIKCGNVNTSYESNELFLLVD